MATSARTLLAFVLNVCISVSCYYDDNSECPMDKYKCEYYVKAKKILFANVTIGNQTNVGKINVMLQDYIEKVSQPPLYKDCVPLVSQHTNCYTGNICIGCTLCDCDKSGLWDCKNIQKCRPELNLIVDQRVLTAVMENFINGDVTMNRKKRSFTEDSKLDTDSESKKLIATDILASQEAEVSIPNEIKNDNFSVTFIENGIEDTYNPLQIMIKYKDRELNKLKAISNNLVSAIKNYTGLNITDNIVSSNKSNNNEIDLNFILIGIANTSAFSRSNKLNTLENYENKLKRDIIEVLRDINAIQKFNKSKSPLELLYLIHALRRYLKYQNNKQRTKNEKFSITSLFRRVYESESNTPNPVFLMNEIFEVIGKEILQNNILEQLPLNIGKIIKRIVKHLYKNNVSYVNMKLKENFHLTGALRSMTHHLKTISQNIKNSNPSELHFKLKLLHLELSADLGVMQDFIALIEFTESRRMNLLDDPNTENILEKALNDLNIVHYYIKKLSQGILNNPRKRLKAMQEKSKKKSFLSKVKRLLKKSKQDIANLIHKKGSKSDILKKIAQKRHDEITRRKILEYETTMQRWQENLSVNPRRKRSTNEFKKFINRIKNIIPNYLHRKVKPAVDKKRLNKNATKHVIRAKHGHKARKSKNKRVASTTQDRSLRTSTNRSKTTNNKKLHRYNNFTKVLKVQK